MNIDIQSLFRDILETPEQRQQRELAETTLRSREMTRNITSRYAAPFAGMVPGFLSNVNRATTGLGSALGLDMRSTSEKAQEALSGLDLTNPQSVQNTVQMLRNVGLGSQAAQILRMSTEAIQDKEEQERIAQLQNLQIEQAQTNLEQSGPRFALEQATQIQQIAESTQRQQTSLENQLLAQQRRDQELTAFEHQEKMNKINLEEAEINLERLRSGESADEIFGGQKILPNGVIYYASQDGDTIVKDINGNVLIGEEAKNALDEGFALETQHQRDIYQARRIGTRSAQIAADSFEKIGSNRVMIANLREAARLVEQGAATTEIERFLTPLNQATNFLKTVTGQLTLDQLSQVTMGALSEKELELLQATAAPSGFNKTEIINWYRDKANATEKALSVLEQQAVYFSQPGASPGEWIEMQRQLRDSEVENDQASDEGDPERQRALSRVLGREIRRGR